MDYLQLLEYLKNYYSNLLIVQYNGKKRAKATIELFVALLYADMSIMQVRDAFNLETAQGAQLDIIGKWVGLDRFYEGQLFDFHPWFSLIDWDDPNPDSLQGGFSTFDTFDTIAGGFLDYQNINPTQNKLPDDTYRLLLRLKIVKNNINQTAKEIDNAIYSIFGLHVYTFWNFVGRELIYFYQPEYNNVLEVARRKNILPCPPTVSLRLEEITN